MVKLTRAWLEDQIDEDVLACGEVCLLHGDVREMDLLDHGCAISGEVEDDGNTLYSVYIEVGNKSLEQKSV